MRSSLRHESAVGAIGTAFVCLRGVQSKGGLCSCRPLRGPVSARGLVSEHDSCFLGSCYRYTQTARTDGGQVADAGRRLAPPDRVRAHIQQVTRVDIQHARGRLSWRGAAGGVRATRAHSAGARAATPHPTAARETRPRACFGIGGSLPTRARRCSRRRHRGRWRRPRRPAARRRVARRPCRARSRPRGTCGGRGARKQPIRDGRPMVGRCGGGHR